LGWLAAFRDLIIADVVDEDEIRTGVRREGAFFGVNALIMRFSTIFVFLTINLVLTSMGWMVFEPSYVTPQVLLGLRMLLSVFPAAVIGIIAISFYPIHGRRLAGFGSSRSSST